MARKTSVVLNAESVCYSPGSRPHASRRTIPEGTLLGSFPKISTPVENTVEKRMLRDPRPAKAHPFFVFFPSSSEACKYLAGQGLIHYSQ